MSVRESFVLLPSALRKELVSFYWQDLKTSFLVLAQSAHPSYSDKSTHLIALLLCVPLELLRYSMAKEEGGKVAIKGKQMAYEEGRRLKL